ncbi:MAG: (d)CMP kinase [Bacteroidales bacterium]|nr:(d)CMP kinase [Bacteroidales bacterium]
MIIAIDGYSSTGKSTFAKLIADRLGLIYLDSGAIYRAVTLFALQRGYIVDKVIDTGALEADLAADKVEISYNRDNPQDKAEICLNGENVESQIRLLDVSNNVSPIATLPFVRNFVDSLLRGYGPLGVVMDGRDIGTAVFPEADLKIFMVADAKIRAQRRVDQLRAKGEEADFDEIYRNVLERDYIDSHREMNPLRQAEDAVVLDNSYVSVDQQMIWLGWVLKAKLNIEL